MSRLTDNDRSWGPFTWGHWHKTFSIMWSSGDEEDGPRKSRLLLAGFGWALRIFVPNILQPRRIRHEANWDEETQKRLGRNHYFQTFEREYGISLSDMGNGYDFLQIHFGAQTNDSLTTQDWCCHLPWKQWDCVRHSMYNPDGSHYFTEPRIGRRGDWDAWWSKRQTCPLVHFGFEDFDGEMIIASCHIEEREWRKGTRWFSWLRYFAKPKIRRDLSIEFDHEVGPEKGSWKGGTTGHGIDMLAGETPEQAFRRYCQMEHERKGRKYKLRFIGPSKPPEPRDTRVARARGWKQCDYPHASAKDMWHHDDAAPCSDGKYISTEEMLDYIKAEQAEHNAQCGMSLKA